MSDWQPIETAPRDGTHFLAAKKLLGFDWCSVVMHYSDIYETFAVAWDHNVEFRPTHWIRLPEPPAKDTDQ